jgi:flavin reductase (DIM6/NTAB) family NADH-FMN oxidoreductase RutF
MKISIGVNALFFPLPVFIVGTYDGENKPNIMTAAWGGICCSEPPMFAVSIRKSRWTYDAIASRKCFTINVPTGSMVAHVDFAGIASGKKNDKFAQLGLTAVKSELIDAPYVDECPVVLECALHTSSELGSHVQFIGEIRDIKTTDECLDEDRKPLISLINPIVYDGAGKEYFKLGGPLGKAFASGKIFWQKTNE